MTPDSVLDAARLRASIALEALTTAVRMQREHPCPIHADAVAEAFNAVRDSYAGVIGAAQAFAEDAVKRREADTVVALGRRTA